MSHLYIFRVHQSSFYIKIPFRRFGKHIDIEVARIRCAAGDVGLTAQPKSPAPKPVAAAPKPVAAPVPMATVPVSGACWAQPAPRSV
jgi:hypothetical protein